MWLCDPGIRCRFNGDAGVALVTPLLREVVSMVVNVVVVAAKGGLPMRRRGPAYILVDRSETDAL